MPVDLQSRRLSAHALNRYIIYQYRRGVDARRAGQAMGMRFVPAIPPVVLALRLLRVAGTCRFTVQAFHAVILMC